MKRRKATFLENVCAIAAAILASVFVSRKAMRKIRRDINSIDERMKIMDDFGHK